MALSTRPLLASPSLCQGGILLILPDPIDGSIRLFQPGVSTSETILLVPQSSLHHLTTS